ncbi:MAG: hypothetical protein MJ252_09745 [archaeon]|nr:hypothetical protein [archaeon]
MKIEGEIENKENKEKKENTNIIQNPVESTVPQSSSGMLIEEEIPKNNNSIKEQKKDSPNKPWNFQKKSKAIHIKLIKDEFSKEKNYSYNETIYFNNLNAFKDLILTPEKFLNLCQEIMTYFKIFIPKVVSGGPKLILSKYNSRKEKKAAMYRMLYNNLNRISSVIKYLSIFKTIASPDRKLVEYDSGKLIKLAELLKKLYANKSKALIFTQMTRMLDILEIFLNIHGFTYVRLDGSTRVELRQQIVDKFNNEPKVFCFISSTRSGGIGLNLTGADSIIFFDTDFNPQSDRQAQDRCHRIGQTRTVNIYRLITRSTIEENIFKKSIQKRELNYFVMEDGNFSCENINSKLNVRSIVQEENLIRQKDNEEEEIFKSKKDLRSSLNSMQIEKPEDDKIKKLLEFENLKFESEEEQKNIEQMLIKIEDAEDVQALKNLSKEMLEEYEKEKNELLFIKGEDKAERMNALMEKEMYENLKPIDKFALNFYKDEFTYKQFLKEKESKMNLDYKLYDSDNESLGEEEGSSLDLQQSESEENEINKMDIDRAYELYLKKKDEIMKMFDDLDQQEKGKEEQ